MSSRVHAMPPKCNAPPNIALQFTTQFTCKCYNCDRPVCDSPMDATNWSVYLIHQREYARGRFDDQPQSTLLMYIGAIYGQMREAAHIHKYTQLSMFMQQLLKPLCQEYQNKHFTLYHTMVKYTGKTFRAQRKYLLDQPDKLSAVCNEMKLLHYNHDQFLEGFAETLQVLLGTKLSTADIDTIVELVSYFRGRGERITKSMVPVVRYMRERGDLDPVVVDKLCTEYHYYLQCDPVVYEQEIKAHIQRVVTTGTDTDGVVQKWLAENKYSRPLAHITLTEILFAAMSMLGVKVDMLNAPVPRNAEHLTHSLWYYVAEMSLSSNFIAAMLKKIHLDFRCTTHVVFTADFVLNVGRTKIMELDPAFLSEALDSIKLQNPSTEVTRLRRMLEIK